MITQSDRYAQLNKKSKKELQLLVKERIPKDYRKEHNIVNLTLITKHGLIVELLLYVERQNYSLQQWDEFIQ